MSTKDLFQLATRLLGLALLYLGIRQLAWIFRAPESDYLSILVTTAFDLGVAWWLVRGANWLMILAYPAEQPAPPRSTK